MKSYIQSIIHTISYLLIDVIYMPIYNYIQGKYKSYIIKRERKRIRKWKKSSTYEYIMNNIINKKD